jgi:hypothetical protein
MRFRAALGATAESCTLAAVTGVLLTLALLAQTAPTVTTPPVPARPGAINGQVQTRDGFPAVAVRVSAIPAPPINIRASDGQNYWATPAPTGTAITDREGRYRLTNIPPGRYYLVAGILGQATYFPGVTESERATVVTLAPAGAETIDFKLAVAHGGRLSGTVSPAGDGTAERAVLSGLKLEEILEMPIEADGTFTYGHVPKGAYLLSIFPTPPGMRSLAFEVGDADVALNIARPPTRLVTGTVKAERGPLPRGLLAFTTQQSHVGARINADGTFTVRLHQGTHSADMVGLPVGYSVASVRSGGADVTRGLTVGQEDISSVDITLTAPRRLPALRGRLTGLAAGAPMPPSVELTGPIVGTITAPIRSDGSFEVAAVTPGRYTVAVPQLASVPPASVVFYASDETVTVTLTAR